MGIFGLAAFSLLVVTGQETPGKSSICGTIQDQAGGALAGGEAQLDLPSGHEPRLTKSDAAGQFCFDALSPDTYELQIKALGFRPERRKVKLASGETTKLKFILMLDTVTQEVTVAEGASNVTSLNVAETKIGEGLLRNLPSVTCSPKNSPGKT